MSITLDQARALDALERHGTFARAGEALHKAHTAVLHAVRALEEQLGVEVVDRRGYRSRLTPAGVRVVDECRRLLAAERQLEAVCRELKSGWEPALRVVFDGVFPVAPLLRVAVALASEGAPTRVDVRAEFLAGVEATFHREEADLMIAVLPPEGRGLVSQPLAPVKASLVARRTHPLARTDRALSDDDLAAHLLLTVHGSDPRLSLPTSALAARSTVHLNDFASKKAAIVEGLGYGWLPEYMIAAELRRGLLRRLRWSRPTTHRFEPRLWQRAGVRLGRAGARVVEALRAESVVAT